MKKTYILDTNILLSDPRAIFGFEDNDVVITQTTLQELDSKKKTPGEIGYNARETIRILESIRKTAKNNDLMEKTLLENGGYFKLVPDDTSFLPTAFSKDRPDNKIIGTALYLENLQTVPTILVTNDISMRINAASAHFLNVEEYRNDHISEETDNYTGVRDYYDNESVFDQLKTSLINGVEFKDTNRPLKQNEFVIIHKGYDKCLAIHKNGRLYLVSLPKDGIFKVMPKNYYQMAALYALIAPIQEIPLVILKGTAGSAKTFLSLAAGLDATFDGMYHKLLISRNNVMADAEFGFLPGDISDKMTPLLAPFYDNLENLFRNHEPNEADEEINVEIDDLFASKRIDVCPLAYMRGRSITHSYLIVDEVQNATRSQIRDIITRAGEGTKIVLCGDPTQVDAHALDRYNNGLVFAAQRFIDSPLCAQITFDSETCVRSDLAKEAINLLQF